MAVSKLRTRPQPVGERSARPGPSATRRRGSRLVRIAEAIGVVVVLVAIWQIVVALHVVPSSGLASPWSVLVALVHALGTAEYWRQILSTLFAWALGMVIVIVVGVPVGVVLGLSRTSYRAAHLTLEFVRTIPSIAALPILVLLFGISFDLTVVLVVLSALWPLLIQSMYGAHDVDPVAMETASVLGLGPRRRFVFVVLPSVAPYVATGLRLAGVVGMALAIAAPLIIGGEGLGAAIETALSAGQVPLMYAGVIVAGAMGLSWTIVLAAIERRLLGWHQSTRSAR